MCEGDGAKVRRAANAKFGNDMILSLVNYCNYLLGPFFELFVHIHERQSNFVLQQLSEPAPKPQSFVDSNCILVQI